MIARHRCAAPRQSGFTLLEIALTLAAVALFIGGILKGWQMVQSSRVRTMAATATSIQSAYLAFQDRYGRVAGDWNAAQAGNAIGQTIAGGGNDSGRLDTPPGDPWTESNAFWEQLGKAGFVRSVYRGTPATEPTVDGDLTPLNVFQRPIIIGRTSDYEGAGGMRRHIVLGRGAPAALLRELDTKLDDGEADQGKVRATAADSAISVFAGTNFWGGRDPACIDGSADWDMNADAQDCNAMLLF